jgi:hypothetical protein
MMRWAVTGVWLGAAAACLQAQDAREIVRRAVENDQHDFRGSRNYTYLQRQETRELDHSGQIKNRKIETWDITLLEGSPYRRLVGRNDQALSAEEQKAEEERLRWNDAQRRMETPDQRAQRLAEWQRRLDRQREPVKEVPDAFTFTLLGEEQLGGRGVYRVEAAPKPGFQPKSRTAAIFPHVKLHLWIDKADFQGARIEMEVLDSISFGGFVVKLTRGTRLLIEQARVDDGVWLPKQFSLTAAARILFVKGLNRELDFTFSGYKKFQVDSKVVAFAEKP